MEKESENEGGEGEGRGELKDIIERSMNVSCEVGEQ